MTTTVVLIAAVVLRIVSNPVANVFQKKLTISGLPPLLVNMITYVLLSLGCLLWAWQIPWQRLPLSFYGWSLLVGIAGGLGNGFLVKALELGDLSVLGPINAYKSVVGIITGVLLLGEWPNAWGLAGVALIVWGSYFVLGTGGNRFSWALLARKEIQFRIWALVLTAIEAVLLKKAIVLASATAAFITWCWAGALFSYIIWMLWNKQSGSAARTISRNSFRYFIPLVICIGTMQFCTNYVFAHMHVGYALSLFQLSAVASVLLGYRMFNETDIAKKLLGCLIMIAGSVLIILMQE